MRASSFWSHRVLRTTVTSVAAVALIAVGVSAAAPGDGGRGPGYPPPAGIYAPFTNCPLKNPLMQESWNGEGTATGCIDGQIQSGSVTVGNITTQVVEPVDVQFGAWDPPNAAAGGDNHGGQFDGGVLPPPAGLSAMVVTKADPIPESLTTALGCPSTDATVESLCQQAAANPADNQVSALAQSAGQLTNFGLLSWTQRIKFQLINPLLGDNCYIGSDNNPIVLNPQVGVGPGGTFFAVEDPDPTDHPNVAVLGITGAVATDNTFTAPGVTGCGPGGTANIPVDLALDAGTGLPAASGNSATFNGNLYFADSFSQTDQATILLSAFKDSTQDEENPQTAAMTRRESVRHTYPAADLRRVLRRFGFR